MLCADTSVLTLFLFVFSMFVRNRESLPAAAPWRNVTRASALSSPSLPKVKVWILPISNLDPCVGAVREPPLQTHPTTCHSSHSNQRLPADAQCSSRTSLASQRRSRRNRLCAENSASTGGMPRGELRSATAVEGTSVTTVSWISSRLIKRGFRRK